MNLDIDQIEEMESLLYNGEHHLKYDGDEIRLWFSRLGTMRYVEVELRNPLTKMWETTVKYEFSSDGTYNAWLKY